MTARESCCLWGQNHGKWYQEYHFRPDRPEMLISSGPLDTRHEKNWKGKATDPSP